MKNRGIMRAVVSVLSEPVYVPCHSLSLWQLPGGGVTDEGLLSLEELLIDIGTGEERIDDDVGGPGDKDIDFLH